MSTTRINSKPRSWLWGNLNLHSPDRLCPFYLAAVAVIGTVVPQNQPPIQYVGRFGETWGKLLWQGRFANVYFSPWLLAPIVLLALNILACIIHGLPQAVRRATRPLSRDAAPGLAAAGRINFPADVDPHPLLIKVLCRELGHYRQETLQVHVLWRQFSHQWVALLSYEKKQRPENVEFPTLED